MSLEVLWEQGLGPGCGFQEICDWTSEKWPELVYNERSYTVNHRIVKSQSGENTHWTYDLPDPAVPITPPTDRFWIGHVVSPRGFLIDGPYRGMPILHAVVMHGGEVAWDPHPDRDSGVGQSIGMGWWTVR